MRNDEHVLATIETATSELQRPVVKLMSLPVLDNLHCLFNKFNFFSRVHNAIFVSVQYSLVRPYRRPDARKWAECAKITNLSIPNEAKGR